MKGPGSLVKNKQRRGNNDRFERNRPIKQWLYSSFLGIILTLAALYFANVWLNARSSDDGLEIYFPVFSTSSTLGVYAVLATVVVALAFSGKLSVNTNDHDLEAMRIRVQENSIILIVAQLISFSSVGAGFIYTFGRFQRGEDAISVEDIISILAIWVIGAALSLIASVVQPTLEHYTAQARVQLPENKEKLKGVKIKSYESVGHRAKRLTTKQKVFLIIANFFWPILVLVVAIILISIFWSPRINLTYATVPLILGIGFLFIVYLGVAGASVGATVLLRVLRWLGLIFWVIAIICFMFLWLRVARSEGLPDELVLANLVSLLAFAMITIPWICMRIPGGSQRKSVFFHHV